MKKVIILAAIAIAAFTGAANGQSTSSSAIHSSDLALFNTIASSYVSQATFTEGITNTLPSSRSNNTEASNPAPQQIRAESNGTPANFVQSNLPAAVPAYEKTIDYTTQVLIQKAPPC